MGLSMMMRRIVFNILFVCALLPVQQVFGNWTEPVETVVGSWGRGAGQFGIEQHESSDFLPRDFGVDQNGIIVIADKVNNRVQLFKSDGSIYKIVNRPAEITDVLWPWTLNVLPEGNSFLAELSIFDYTGSLLSKINTKRTERYATNNNYIIYNMDTKSYSFYSPTGQLIKTSTARPAELGDIKEARLSGGKYKYTVKYPDGIYTVISDTIFEEGLARDSKMNIYGIGTITNPQDIYVSAEWEDNAVSEKPQPHYIVSRFSPCGKLQGRIDLPADKSKFKKTTTGVIRDESLLRQYGKPLVAPNGDVYAWQRTSTTYSIIKWTWVDDQSDPSSGPDVPTGLSVMPSTTGLYLTWTASPQDPGCVTGYEIARAATSGGVYSTVATVDKGVVKYNDTTANAGTTYYYKVRAKAGDEYSPFTPEVSGKR